MIICDFVLVFVFPIVKIDANQVLEALHQIEVTIGNHNEHYGQLQSFSATSRETFMPVYKP